MYLSRVEIDKYNRRKIRDLSHVGAYHHWVEESFPSELAENKRTRKLWRIDYLNGKDYLLIVSQTAPDINRLERYGVPGSAEVKSYDSFLDQLSEGMEMRFRISLNPVISKYSSDSPKRGRVKPHVTDEYQRKFLLDRSEKNGFHLDDDQFLIVESGMVLLKKHGQPDLRLMKATYEGQLTITDAEKFRKTLTEGFGKKKAYGFGMMTVIPLG